MSDGESDQKPGSIVPGTYVPWIPPYPDDSETREILIAAGLDPEPVERSGRKFYRWTTPTQNLCLYCDLQQPLPRWKTPWDIVADPGTGTVHFIQRCAGCSSPIRIVELIGNVAVYETEEDLEKCVVEFAINAGNAARAKP